MGLPPPDIFGKHRWKFSQKAGSVGFISGDEWMSWWVCYTTEVLIGYGPFTVTVANEGLVRDSLLKMVHNPGGHDCILWGGHTQGIEIPLAGSVGSTLTPWNLGRKPRGQRGFGTRWIWSKQMKTATSCERHSDTSTGSHMRELYISLRVRKKKANQYKGNTGKHMTANDSCTVHWYPPELASKTLKKSITSWWLNHPVEKYARQNGSSPQVGFKIKNVWNHHLPASSQWPFDHPNGGHLSPEKVT